MPKYDVSVTAIYVGSIVVTAENEREAHATAEKLVNEGFPCDFQFSGIQSIDNPELIEIPDDIDSDDGTPTDSLDPNRV